MMFMKKFLSLILVASVISSIVYNYDKNTEKEVQTTILENSMTQVEESTKALPSTTLKLEETTEQEELEATTKKIEETTTKKKIESTTKKKVVTTTHKPATTKKVIDPIKPVTPNPSAEEKLAFDLLNEYRKEQGLYPLKWNSDVLHAAAEIRAKECPIKWSHERPDGTHFETILIDNGYIYAHASENLCLHTTVPENLIEKMIQCLKDSPSHNKAMLTTRDVEVGIAYYEAEDGNSYLVQIFGVRQNNV
jgi:uncharacterized protein YkwD